MKRDYSVNVKKGKVLVREWNESLDDFKSVFSKLQGLNKSIMESEGQKKQLEVGIKEKMLEGQLEKVEENLKYMVGLRNALDKAVRPFVNEMVDKACKKVDFLKKKESYDRVSGDRGVVLQAKIMSDVSSELGFDVNHVVMREVRSKMFPKKEGGKKS